MGWKRRGCISVGLYVHIVGYDNPTILTEGDSAKALAVAGLGVVGRDNFGVFPLRGKMLNVRYVFFVYGGRWCGVEC